jgi:DNA polymerase-3 subunit gamma/tau
VAYLVLARKWRPRGFDAITGQEHVTRTLKNAITQNRVHHAFLFCGARGVGKTSAARVFARALNCRKGDGPTTDPCGECSACIEITAGTAVDVFEIDGASNRGIGEIRELRDGVAYAPQRDRYKIYIIDEVHMLTTEAFNALLKTLEEPPAHVKFIFATTEPHKIPVTILSRCQRFDFKRIPLAVMAQRLSEILASEGVNMDPAGLRLVARESEGSMRDALSLLDRVISFAGTEATYETVASVLGVADRAWLNGLVQAAIDRNIPAALSVVGEAFEYGLDLKKFASDIVHHLRDAAILQVAGDQAPTDLSKDERDALTEVGKRFQPEDLQRLVRLWTETAERLVQASFPRLEVEMAVIRMCRLRPLQPIDGLIQRLEALERRLESGTPLPPIAATPPGTLRPKAETPVPTGAGVKTLAPAELAAPVVAAPPVVIEAPAPAPVVEAPAPVVEPAPVPVVEAPAPVVEPPAPVVEPPAPIVEPPAPVVEPPAPIVEPPPPSIVAAPPEAAPTVLAAATPKPETAKAEAPRKAKGRAKKGEAASVPTAPVPTGPIDNEAWEVMTDLIRPGDPLLAGILDHARVARFEDGVLSLEVSGDVTTQRLMGRIKDIETLVSAQRPDVTRVEIGRVGEVANTPHQRRLERERKVYEAKRRDVEKHPLVVELLERFGGTLGAIEVEDDRYSS